jgi:CHAT domain-containing protein
LRKLAATGQFKKANDLASSVIKENGAAADPVAVARFDLLHARLLMYTRYGETAADAIQRARTTLETSNDPLLAADLAATNARLLVTRHDLPAATAAFDAASAGYEKADATNDLVDTLTAALPSVSPERRAGYRQKAEALVGKATLQPEQTLQLRVALAATSDAAGDATAATQWLEIARSADAAKEPRLAAAAWTHVASLYDAAGQPDDALVAARKGLFAAQQAGADDLKFQLDWQIARLQRGRKTDDLAIDSYFRAVRSLQSVRHDLLIYLARSGAPTTFRQNIGPVYYQLADMLIRRSETKTGAEQQGDLKLARQVVEQLKTVELEDYFQDQCVNLAKEQEQIVDRDLLRTAVIYVIPLADRTEILISTPSGTIERVTSPATDREITAAARQFRYDATNRRNNNYMKSGRQLHDWLIAPIEPVIRKSHSGEQPIDTLVFVPDGELRTVPMAALWDGEKFLVEKYAVAISPGLTLMRPEPLNRAGKQLQVLKAGVTIQRTVGDKVFAALPSVSGELAEIGRLYPGATLKDETFRNVQFEQRLEEDAFTIVHIASHGQFRPDARDTFILTFDSTLSLDMLERLMLPSKFRDQPIELLTLSACQTATGDDGARAALGMAGIAVKAGARSAMATLWFVSDEASSELVGKFYSELRDHSELSRAEALQRAQLQILDTDRFRHPYYWAPFLMIGNWK